MRRRRHRVRSASLRATVERPSSSTSPDVGTSSSPANDNNVLLPDPEGPITATNSPCSIRSETPSRARTVRRPRRYVLTALRNSNMSGSDGFGSDRRRRGDDVFHPVDGRFAGGFISEHKRHIERPKSSVAEGPNDFFQRQSERVDSPQVRGV